MWATSMTGVAGIHCDNVSRFFREHVPGGDCDLSFSLISSGRSNLTYSVSGGSHRWVLRRPPLGHVLPTAHDMAREYRVLTALAETDVPAPRPFALCEDTSINDMPFYVMEYCPGLILAQELPPGYAESEGDRRRMSVTLIDTLVRLHAVDYRAVGLEGFGHPEGYLERQVRRWSQQWELSQTSPLPGIDELIRRLRAALPESPPPTIVHGDYRLGNMALDPNDPGRIMAVLDWEMATLGDPLADLGYCSIYWTEKDDPPPSVVMGTASTFTALPGFFTRAEMVAEYAQRSGRNVEAVDFYQVLALYKLAVIAEGIYARYLPGQDPGRGLRGHAACGPGLGAGRAGDRRCIHRPAAAWAVGQRGISGCKGTPVPVVDLRTGLQTNSEVTMKKRETVIELYYWPGIQGRGEFVRLLLEDAGAAYVDVARERKNGMAAMMRFLENEESGPLPFAPPFVKVGNVIVSQTANILAFIAPRFGLVPDDDVLRAEASQIQLTLADFVGEIHDTHHPIAGSLYYEDQKSAAKRRARHFVKERMPISPSVSGCKCSGMRSSPRRCLTAWRTTRRC